MTKQTPIEALKAAIEGTHRAVGMITTDHRFLFAECGDCANARAALGQVEAVVAALRAEQLLTLKAPNPFGHDCEWCGKCVQRVVEMNFAALGPFLVLS